MAFAMQPLAACFSGEMTASEEQCCAQMAGDCGQVSMPTSHSCCRYVDRSDTARPETKGSFKSTAPVALVALGSRALISLSPRIGWNVAATAESPPGSPSYSLQVLRI